MDLAQSPFVTPETLAWAEAAVEGNLLIKRCDDCDRPHYYPRPFCPFCFSQNVAFVEASGRGTIYSFSITRMANPPYVLAYVSLDEGPTILTNIVDAPLTDIAIGDAVELTFCESALGFPAPMFRKVAR